MSTVHVVIGYSRGRGVGGAALPIPDSDPSQVQTINSGAGSTASTITVTQAEVNDGAIWFITSDANVWVNFGASPSAASGSGWLVAAGTTREFFARLGHKVAVRDA